MSAARNITPPAFFPVWGPSEDGVAVARGKRSSFQGHHKVDWIIGFSPYESASWVGQSVIENGITDNIFYEKVIRTWIRNTRKNHHREVMAAILQEYTDWTVTQSKPLKKRNILLSLLTDAGFTAPMYKEADILAERENVFIFICDLVTKEDNEVVQYPGWELSLVWGIGLDKGSSTETVIPPLSPPELDQVSEDLITLLTNFAKSGDPNLPKESPSPGFAAIAWPPYQKYSKKYLKLGIPPSVGENYRSHQLALWNWLIPELEAAGEIPYQDSSSWEYSTDRSLFYGEVMPPDPWDFMPNPSTTKSYIGEISAAPAAQETTLGYASPQLTTTLALAPTMTENIRSIERNEYMNYSTALLVTGGLGISLLMLNGFVFILLFWRKSGIQESQKSSKSYQLTNKCKVPRITSLLNMGAGMEDEMCTNLQGTYGIPPDCIRNSCDNLNIPDKPLENVCCNRLTATNLQSQSVCSEANSITDNTKNITNVIPSSQSYKQETSFTLSPSLLNNVQLGVHHVHYENEYREKAQGHFYSLQRQLSTPGLHNNSNNELCLGNSDSIDGQKTSSCSKQHDLGIRRVNSIDRINRGNEQSPSNNICNLRIANGWESYEPQALDHLPQAPPPPRLASLRKEKKVTIVEEAVQRL